MKKILFFLSFIFICCFSLISVYSINLDELVNSYDYTYSQNDFKLNSSKLDIKDETQINLELNLTARPQVYNLTLILSSKKNGNFKIQNFVVNRLVNIINIPIEVSNLDEDNYTISLFIYDENNILVYRNYNLYEIEINTGEFLLDNSYEIQDESTKYFIINNSRAENIFYEISTLNSDENLRINENIYISDLAIKNISYDNLTGETLIEIINFGSSDAIWYDFSVVDENFNLIHEHFEHYLEQNKSKNLVITLEQNLSIFHVILDYNNNIEENYKFNNILSWPVNNLTEICNDNLDNNRNGFTDENCILEIVIDQINETNLSTNLTNNNSLNLEHNISNNINLNQNNSNLSQNNSNSTPNNLEYVFLGSGGSESGAGGWGGSGGSGNSNLNVNLKNSVNLNDILNKKQNEILENEELIFNFEDFQTKIKLIKINLENIEINYNDENLILSNGESIILDYNNKSVMVKYLGNELDKAIFSSEFENENDDFEIKTKLEEKELNFNLQENISNRENKEKLENYDSLKNIINASSNIYNSSNFYYLNNSTKSDSKNIFLEFKEYILLFSLLITIILVYFK